MPHGRLAMNKRDFALLAPAIVAAVSTVLAQVPALSKDPDHVGLAPAIESPQTLTTLSLQGTIDNYTPATRTLSLSTPRGTIRFFIAPTIRIRQGWRKLDVSDLEKLAGHRATVRYTQAGDRPVVESVHVFGR
jgi:hypothetical protein